MQATLERVRAGEARSGLQKLRRHLRVRPFLLDRALIQMLLRAQCRLLKKLTCSLPLVPVWAFIRLRMLYLWQNRLNTDLIIVNAEPTAMDGVADVVLRGAIGEILPELARSTQPG